MNQKVEVLKEASEYIEKMVEGIKETINCLKNNEEELGYKFLMQITEGLDWLFDVITLTQDIQVEKVNTKKIQEAIKSLLEAMENQDRILIIDILEYEIIDEIDSWKEQLQLTIKNYYLK